MKFIFNKKILILFTALVLIAFFGKTVFAVWNNTFYNPGDTLDPECLPTDTDCDVLIPVGHDAVTLGTANGLSLSTQVLSLALASTSTTGALSDTDWNIFNGKQNALNGTGFVKISGTTISYDNSTYLTSVGTGVTNELTYWSGTNTLGSLATATYPSLTELSYVKGVTSAIQTQLDSKASSTAYTLAGVSAISTDATKSLYTMSSGVPVEFKTSGGGHLLYLDETNARVGIGTTAPGAALQVNGAASGITSIFKANATTPGNITEWQNSSGTALANISASGGIDAVYGSFRGAGNGTWHFQAGSGGQQMLAVKVGTNEVGGYSGYGASANGTFRWTNASTDAFGTVDTALSRISAGVVGVGNGTAGDSTGSLYARKINLNALTDVAALQLAAWDILRWDNSNQVSFGGITPGQWQALKFYTNNAEAMRIDSSGNVGIGTTAPGSMLTVAGSFAANSVYSAGSIEAGSTIRSNTGQFYSAASDLHLDAYNGSAVVDRLHIKADTGNIGIGTTAPNDLLDVTKSSVAGVGGRILINNSATATIGNIASLGFRVSSAYTGGYYSSQIQSIDTDGVASSRLGFLVYDAVSGLLPGGTERMSILANGNVGIGTTAPGTKLDVNGGVMIRGANTNTVSTPISALELITGRGTTGAMASGQTTADISFQYGGTNGGYRHFIETTHNSSTTGNRMLFYLNNSATAGGSSAPGTGNVLGLALVDGNVGIGTTAPGSLLDVDGGVTIGNGTSFGLRTRANNNSGSWSILYGDGVNNVALDNRMGADVWFGTSGVEKMRITSGGNVGIGTSAPGALLSVNGNATVGTVTPYSYAGTPVGLTVQGSGTYGVLALKADQPLIKWVGTYNSGNGAELYQNTTGDFILNPNDSTYGFKITATGNGIFGINTSKVGIGTTVPTAKLEISGGNLLVQKNNTIGFNYTDGVGDTYQYIKANGNTSGLEFYNTWTNLTTQEAFTFYGLQSSVVTPLLTILNGGNVGIGTTDPQALLAVNGGNVLIGATAKFDPNEKLQVSSLSSSDHVYLDVVSIGNTQAGFNLARNQTAGSYNTTWFNYIPASSTDLRWYNSSDKMTLSSSGYLGIGTTAPGAKLEINKDGEGLRLDGTSGQDRQIYFRNIAAGTARLTADGTLEVGTNANYPITFKANLSESARILGNGNVGIGTTSPTKTLDVVGSDATNPIFTATNNANGAFVPVFEVNSPNLTVGNNTYFAIGRDRSNYDQFSFGFTYAGLNSTSNRFDVNAYGTSPLLSILGSGKVGIGTTAPTTLLAAGTNNGLLNFDDNTLSGAAGGSPSFTIQTGPSSGVNAGAYMNLFGKLESWVVVTATSNTSGQRMMRFGNSSNGCTNCFAIQSLNDAGTSINATPFQLANNSPTNSLLVNTTGISTVGTLIVSGTGNTTIAGNVGIKTTAPSKTLEIGGTNTGIQITNADSGQDIGANGLRIITSTAAKGAGVQMGNANTGSTDVWQFFAKGSTLDFAIGRANVQDNILLGGTSGAPKTFFAGPNVGATMPAGNFTLMASAGTNAAYIPIVARGNASQTANLQEWQNSSGTVLTAVDKNGYIGIGTTAPLVPLQIASSPVLNKGMLTIVDTSYASTSPSVSASLTGYGSDIGSGSIGRSWFIGNDGGIQQFDIFYQQNAPMAFFTNATQQMTILGNGNVGIGTTAPNNLTDGYGASAAISKLWVSDTTASKYVGAVLNGPTTGGSSLTFATGGATRAGVGYNDASNTFDIMNYTNGEPVTFFTNSGTVTEKMRLLSTGYLGIGTTNPDHLLTITNSASANGLFSIKNTSSTGYSSFDFYDSSSNLVGGFGYGNTGLANAIWSGNMVLHSVTKNFVFSVDGATSAAMYIKSDGKVGIGTTTPSEKLSVTGNMNFTSSSTISSGSAFDISGATLNINAGVGSVSGGNLYLAGGDGLTDGDTILAHNGSAAIGFVGIGMTDPSVALDVTGDIEYTGTITDVSDMRLKENIQDFNNGLSIIKGVTVKTFNMIGSTKNETGFIAQNIKEIFPEAVSIVDPANGYMGVSYVSFIPVLTQAVQELNTNLESLTLPITEENNTQTFTERFFGKLAAWLADASNGVAKIFTGEIDTKSLCVSDDSGAKTCLTKAQLDALILQAGTSSTSTPTPVTDPVPTPDPAPAPVSDPVPIPEPIPTPDPTPEPIPEPTVTPDPAPITDPIPAPAPDPVPVSDPVPAL